MIQYLDKFQIHSGWRFSSLRFFWHTCTVLSKFNILESSWVLTGKAEQKFIWTSTFDFERLVYWDMKQCNLTIIQIWTLLEFLEICCAKGGYCLEFPFSISKVETTKEGRSSVQSRRVSDYATTVGTVTFWNRKSDTAIFRTKLHFRRHCIVEK